MSDGQTTKQDFRFSYAGAVSGTVLDRQYGSPLNDAQVIAVQTDDPFVGFNMGTSQAPSGTFQIDNLDAVSTASRAGAHYDVTASADGYSTGEISDVPVSPPITAKPRRSPPWAVSCRVRTSQLRLCTPRAPSDSAICFPVLAGMHCLAACLRALLLGILLFPPLQARAGAADAECPVTLAPEARGQWKLTWLPLPHPVHAGHVCEYECLDAGAQTWIPSWSADGNHLVYWRAANSPLDDVLEEIDVRTSVRRTLFRVVGQRGLSVACSPEGKRIAYVVQTRGNWYYASLWLCDSNGRWRTWMYNVLPNCIVKWSPNGRWLAWAESLGTFRWGDTKPMVDRQPRAWFGGCPFGLDSGLRVVNVEKSSCTRPRVRWLSRRGGFFSYCWSSNDRCIYLGSADTADPGLFSINVTTGQERRLHGTARTVTGGSTPFEKSFRGGDYPSQMMSGPLADELLVAVPFADIETAYRQVAQVPTRDRATHGWGTLFSRWGALAPNGRELIDSINYCDIDLVVHVHKIVAARPVAAESGIVRLGIVRLAVLKHLREYWPRPPEFSRGTLVMPNTRAAWSPDSRKIVLTYGSGFVVFSRIRRS